MLTFSLIVLNCCFVVLTAIEPSPSPEPPPKPIGRIVGGTNAKEVQFPHQVSLMRNGRHLCGGSIITMVYIITAAHCVGETDRRGTYRQYVPKVLRIRAGTVNRGKGGVVVRVAKVIPHEKYGNYTNDIALLRLARPLLFRRKVQPIALANAAPPPGSKVAISGWGKLSTRGGSPRILQWTTLTAISTNECYQAIKTHSESLLCLSHPPRKGACLGDSGGPATLNGKLVGVASYVNSACGSTYPDVYTKVFYFLNWIRSKTMNI